MMLSSALGNAAVMAYAPPALGAAAAVRVSRPLVMSEAETEGVDAMPSTTDLVGKVVPTGGVAEPAPEPTVAAVTRNAAWNPEGLDVSKLPAVLQQQFVPGYLKASPAYLDGTMPGDNGFDPWALVALASPVAATDKFARTAADRDAKMLSMSAAEQQQALAWMRESEIKHGRLAMLAAAGWPLAELASHDYLSSFGGGTNGRAPSLFNGHLFDVGYLPSLVLFFGGMAFLEFTNKDKLTGGDYGFDPMGLAGDQKPYGAFPFDAFLGKTTPIDSIPNAKDMEAMKLAELKNGRLAMMAITGMAIQEFVYGTAVVDQTPFFFGR